MIMKWNEPKYRNEIIGENRMRIFIDPIFIIFFYLKETERSANLVSPNPSQILDTSPNNDKIPFSYFSSNKL